MGHHVAFLSPTSDQMFLSTFSWAQNASLSSPPYPKGIIHSGIVPKRELTCLNDTSWNYIPTNEGQQYTLLNGHELCELVQSQSRLLLLGDSLTEQLYRSWFARLAAAFPGDKSLVHNDTFATVLEDQVERSARVESQTLKSMLVKQITCPRTRATVVYPLRESIPHMRSLQYTNIAICEPSRSDSGCGFFSASLAAAPCADKVNAHPHFRGPRQRT